MAYLQIYLEGGVQLPGISNVIKMPFICSFTDVQLMKNFWDAVQQADEESTDYQVESLVGPCTALIFSYANYKSLHQ